jgi:cytochrome c biogenesis factor
VATVGRALLILALAVAIWGVVASLVGARRNRPELIESGRRAIYALALLTTAAFLILEVAFLRSDFTYVTVTEHSSTTTPTFYKGAAAWSSQEGSLLLWVWLLSLWSSARAVPHAAADARRGALRDSGAGGLRGVLRRPARLRGDAVRDDRRRCRPRAPA